MSGRTSIIVAAVMVCGLVSSLLARPVEPFEAPVMQALADTQATVEDWSMRGLELLTPQGVPVSWADEYQGRPLYLSFWAEWCEVCKSELPSLSAFAQASQGRYDVVTVCIDQDPSAALAYLRETFPEGVGFGVLLDPGGAVAQRFGTTGVPETFLIGPAGTVMARWVGPRDFAQPIHQQLASLVSRGSR